MPLMGEPADGLREATQRGTATVSPGRTIDVARPCGCGVGPRQLFGLLAITTGWRPGGP
jgi:hypothetical protein